MTLNCNKENKLENMKVTKRDGSKEAVDLDKIHRVLEWAVEGLDNVSVSQIEMKSSIQLFDGMTTQDIHETLVKTAADLISETNPNYQYVAARLAIFDIRKEAYGRFTPPSLYSHISGLTQKGLYDKHILEDYSKEEIEEIEKHIDHDRDLNFAYAAVQQLQGKYLVQNRVSKKVYESPQMLNMLVAMCLFSRYKENRLDYVIRFYDAVSEFRISLPTPIMSGVRTPTRQFSSCVVIESDDTLDSINATASSIVNYVSRRAGIGINAGRIRALGSEIRGGEAQHTGVIPFLKYFQAAVKSCSQGGVRGGAATVFYPLWHLEAESLLVLKNNRGVEDNRVRHMDYGVQINKLLYTRLIKGQDITLFSPSDVPNLYESFFADQELFEELYVKYENDDSIRKKVVPASELFSLLLQERASTGRIYIQNVDHCNTHSPFKPDIAPIRQSNLCMEIALPTKPLNDKNDPDGEIALCTLAAVNLGKIENIDCDMKNLTDLLVRALDELIDYQDYPSLAAEGSSKKRRMLGIGVVNYAYYLAKNGVKYSDGSAKDLTHETFEALQYYLLKASNELAKEKGACEWFDETKYSEGILNIDTYKDSLDEVCDTELMKNWEVLRGNIKKFGLRNSTLSALMPSETSSQISNATNGIEPPRGLISVKASKDGILKQVVPEIENPEVVYELLWDIPNNKGYLELVAIMQKFVDQSISANTNYDPSKFASGRVPMKQLIQDLLTAYKLGVKTLYYHNTRDGANDAHEDDCESGACKI
jgi:ribonucleoside-diphosphate reductase alpha chain